MSEENNNILKDETLDFNKSKQYWMSILINRNGLSFVIIDTLVSKVIAYSYLELPDYDNPKEYCYFVNKELKTNGFCAYEYKNISIVYQTNKSVLIPDNLYSESFKVKFFELNTKLEDNEIVLHNNISQMGAKKLFAIPECIYDGIQNNFLNAKIYHQSTGVIKLTYIQKTFNSIYLSLHKNSFDIQIFNKEKLILDNSFMFKAKEDLLYYLLYTFEQLNLDPKKQKITLFSSYDAPSGNIEFIKDYISEIEVATNSGKINYSYLFSQQIMSQLNSQIKIIECEL